VAADDLLARCFQVASEKLYSTYQRGNTMTVYLWSNELNRAKLSKQSSLCVEKKPQDDVISPTTTLEHSNAVQPTNIAVIYSTSVAHPTKYRDVTRSWILIGHHIILSPPSTRSMSSELEERRTTSEEEILSTCHR